VEEVSKPPPAPRNVPRNQVWRILVTDGVAIVGMIFLLMGAIFGITGAGLTMGIITAIVGIPFAGVGLLMFGIGLWMMITRFQRAERTMQVLREGEAVLGEIVQVYQNWQIRVNGRHPWTILYRYEVGGQRFDGRITTLMRPDLKQQAGKGVYVLYSPGEPAHSTIYPHPYGYHGV
jgi:hypothetical protein